MTLETVLIVLTVLAAGMKLTEHALGLAREIRRRRDK